MALAKRVIPCLDVTAGRVVKGVNFTGLRDAGDPVEIARRYEAAGFTDFLAIGSFGGLPHKQVLRSLELMARHVLPRFADRRDRPGDGGAR